MKCREVRTIIGRDTGVHDEVREHLAACAPCAQFAQESQRIWDLLGTVPEVPVSDGFQRRLLARARAEDTRPRALWSFGRVPGWQWMTVAAGLLLTVVLISPRLADRQSAHAVSSTDKWDDSFLEELDTTLQRSETNYLPAYDEWADEAGQEPETPQALPGPQDDSGGVRHGKS